MKSFEDEQETFDIIDALDSNDIEMELQKIEYSSTTHIQLDALERIKDKTFKNIGIKKLKHKKLRVGLRIAAVFLVFTIAGVGYLGPSNVWAAIKNAIEYIPGIGVTLNKQETTERYVLESPIKKDVNGKFVELKGAILEGQRLVISITGNNPDGPIKNTLLIDGNGKKYKGLTLSSGGGLDRESSSSNKIYRWWQATYMFTINNGEFKNLQVSLDKNTCIIPFSLKKAEVYGSYDEIGTTVFKNGIGITAITTKHGENLKINYLTKLDQGNNIGYNYFITGFPIRVPQASLKGKSGSSYKQYSGLLSDSNGLGDFNGLYFDLYGSTEKEFNLTIPYVDINSKDEKKITVDVPDKGELNLGTSINLANYPVEIKSVKRINANYIALMVDTHYDKNKAESLFGFFISYAEDYGINEEGAMSNNYIPNQKTFDEALNDAVNDLNKRNDHSKFYLSECDYPGHEYLKAVLIPIKSDMKTIDLNISLPHIVKSGPWEFDIKLN